MLVDREFTEKLFNRKKPVKEGFPFQLVSYVPYLIVLKFIVGVQANHKDLKELLNTKAKNKQMANAAHNNFLTN